ncbi:MAG: hypothetical protein LE169_01335 [Endomicrobium sp.]|nr:hypothetical protein [Endomicrobium sp.]
MILFCPEAHKIALEEADAELTSLSMKIKRQNQKIKKRKIIKDFLKSFPHSFYLMSGKNEDKRIYIAVVLAGGIGDIIRQKSAVLKLIDIFPSVIIDIYNIKSKPFLADVKNIRFFFYDYSIELTRKKYDIIVDYLSLNKVTSGIADLKINNLKNDILKKFATDFEEIKKEYPYCFGPENQYLFQKEAVKNGLNINSVMKLTAGIKDVEENDLVLNYKYQDIAKFGLSKRDKYITFQHGWGNRGYVPRINRWHTKIWETKSWKRLLENIKRKLKYFKIVQVGISSDCFEETDIDLNGKTSFDELCSVIKYSSLHIDTDGGCVHIARALNVKSVVLFGPSNARYVGYENNINITSGLCSDCFTVIKDWDLKCIRGFDKAVCMNSISPDFVAKVICNQLA